MKLKELKTDIVIVGGGLGSIAAAISIAKLGKKCIITEETDWIGGQLTSQAVPMDEHPWMEFFGCTQTYRQLRNEIREYYKKYYPVTSRSRMDPYFSPGASLTTRLPCEPKIALSALFSMLAPFCSNESITILTEYKPEEVEIIGDVIKKVRVKDLKTGDFLDVSGEYFLEGTENGEILKLGNIEYVTGAESRNDTKELHAEENKDPQNMQAFTFCYALSYYPDEDNTIDKPETYEFWKNYQAPFQTNKNFSWNPQTNRKYQFFPDKEVNLFSIWQYRRILYKKNFENGFLKGDLSLMNSSHNDYWLGSIIDVSENKKIENIEKAKQLSLSEIYWLQTDAPRPDGGVGYPGLKLRYDYTNTRDGLAKYPYIRESRRLLAEFQILEQHVGLEALELDNLSEAVNFPDTIGIGCYNIDLHPTTGGQPSLNIPTRPFQISLGALIPRRVKNLIAASKNIGTTHITNGCYRLHSIEWNIGEAAGVLAAYCLKNSLMPTQVRNKTKSLTDYQKVLKKMGIELEWPKFIKGTSYHKHFKDITDWDWGENDKRNLWNI
ncbi:FAD dependent oxidoreductase [Tangfeifania diversioriginum]|uniref:FAD dependent oxidoreductase n=1 Tax=Tangfeifania diversioriginum TaxID=1168035 RepID=A0A1M6PN53_9BACT|nr:FAD-dependent oxidoreductase [Tangfeifania diversioriginum]SHK09389.1 FAD dependent oxidoreductase [Tangfeifania diversioriginum]